MIDIYVTCILKIQTKCILYIAKLSTTFFVTHCVSNLLTFKGTNKILNVKNKGKRRMENAEMKKYN